MTAAKKGGDELFQDLFVLELANNHWGDVERGKQIIREHGRVVEQEGVKAAIKFQFRDVDTFIHSRYKIDDDIAREGEVVTPPGSSSRYIKKTLATKLTPDDFSELLGEVRAHRLITMATPFDERTVDWCRDLDVDIVKIASQDAKAWTLIKRIVDVGKPAVISNGGTEIEDLDHVVQLFKDAGVPLAINHCVSLYPSEDDQLELNQVDFLRNRYPNHVIGFSSHEYHDWSSSVMIAAAKGARTFERHIDIEDAEGTPVSKYCSLPHQVGEWFRAYKKAKEMMGRDPSAERTIPEEEREYVSSVSRGAYALRDLPEGHVITQDGLGTDYELAIPLHEGQISARDLDQDHTIKQGVAMGEPIPLNR